LSDDFLRRARGVAADADVVVFSHPWLYPLLADGIDRSRQLLAYDAQNVEALLRHDLLRDSAFGREVAKGAAMAEAFLCREADLVIGCSDEDLAFFCEAYGISRQKTAVVRNGVFVETVVPRPAVRPEAAKAAVGIAGPAAIFVGSNYPPNQEAANFIVRTLAPALPEILFVLCGGVGRGTSGGGLPPNVRCTGNVSDEDKLRYLHAADVAVNPMYSGSGTNIKMFDFMAAALPVVSTRIGARGICDATTHGVIVSSPDDMPRELRGLMGDERTRARLGSENRRWVEQAFSWESQSPALGRIIIDARERHGAAKGRTGPDASSRDGESDLPMPGVGAATGVATRIGILSSFGIRCGIAEYTTYLAEALVDVGAELTIVANRMEGHAGASASVSQSLKHVAVERIWRYDGATWARGGGNADEVVRTVRARGVEHLNVQYHRAFFSEEALLDLLRTVLGDGTPVSLTLHNSTDAAEWFLQALADMRVRVVLHRKEEEVRLRAAGVDAWYLPQGIPTPAREGDGRPQEPLEGVGRGPLIASFGFLRPHKGLVELVEALSILRGVFPGIRLLAQTSLYPSADSAEYLERVGQRIDALALGDAVILDSDFRPIDVAIARLARADVIVLPYAASDEGSSAAAATALAARRPLVTTQSRIFDDVREAAYMAEDNSPPVLAAAIATVLSNGGLRRHLERRARRLAEARDWRNVARRLVELTTGTRRGDPVDRPGDHEPAADTCPVPDPSPAK